MKNSNILKWVVPVFALALVLAGVPGYGATQCSDSPSIVVLPDCTTISITTCYCEVADDGSEDLTVTIIDLDNTVADETLACDGFICDLNGDLAAEVEIAGFQQRNNKGNNATPAKNGKTTTTVTCIGCDDDQSADADIGPAARKNSHFDTLLQDSGDTFICKVGLNSHTKANACD